MIDINDMQDLSFAMEDDASLLDFEGLITICPSDDPIFGEDPLPEPSATSSFDGYDHSSDDEVSSSSSCDSSLCSNTFDVGKQEPNKQFGEFPSMEDMMEKLDKSMRRSAETRTIVFNTILPDLNKTLESELEYQRLSPISKYKASARKAKRTVSKRSLCNSKAARKKVFAVAVQKSGNSISDFLRASKKW